MKSVCEIRRIILHEGYVTPQMGFKKVMTRSADSAQQGFSNKFKNRIDIYDCRICANNLHKIVKLGHTTLCIIVSLARSGDTMDSSLSSASAEISC